MISVDLNIYKHYCNVKLYKVVGIYIYSNGIL